MNETFHAELKKQADAIVAKYETRRASILEILRLVMEHYGYITLQHEEDVAAYLEIAPIDVREVVTFYTLFYTKPKAEKRLMVCRTLSCALMGAGQIFKYLEEKLGIKPGEMTGDGKFSLEAVECLGACELAPMMQLDDDEYVGCLTKQKINQLLNVGENKN